MIHVLWYRTRLVKVDLGRALNLVSLWAVSFQGAAEKEIWVYLKSTPYEDERGYLYANLIILSCRSDKDQRNIVCWKWLLHYIIVCWSLPQIRLFLLFCCWFYIYIYILLRSIRVKRCTTYTSFDPCQSANGIHLWCPHPVWWRHQWIMDDCWQLYSFKKFPNESPFLNKV